MIYYTVEQYENCVSVSHVLSTDVGQVFVHNILKV